MIFRFQKLAHKNYMIITMKIKIKSYPLIVKSKWIGFFLFYTLTHELF